MIRGALLGVVAALVCAACSGEASIETPSLEQFAAEDFAVSARRALADTRFEALGDRWLSGLLVEMCGDLAGGGDPEEVVAAAVAGVDAPEGPDVDDEILAEVLTAGVAEVCSNAVLGAGGLAPEAVSGFLGVVRPVAGQSGLGALDDASLLVAGLDACGVLDAGSGAAAAGAEILRSLFGIDASDLAGLEAAGLGAREGIVAGAVLGAAATVLCPEHSDEVAAYVSGVRA